MQLPTQNKLRLVPPSLVTLSLEEGGHCESIKLKAGEHASKKVKHFFFAFGIYNVPQGLVAQLMALFEAGGIVAGAGSG